MMLDFWDQAVGREKQPTTEQIEQMTKELQKEVEEVVAKNNEKLYKASSGPWSVELKIVNKSPNKNPEYANEGDSGFDLRAWVQETDDNAKFDKERGEWYVELKSLQRQLIHTGIYCEIPNYCEIQVRPRSGLALKHGISVCNTPGTVDCMYRNEVGVILVNLSNEKYRVYNGERIAQAVLCPVYSQSVCKLSYVDSISAETSRGLNGFGSSGMK